MTISELLPPFRPYRLQDDQTRRQAHHDLQQLAAQADLQQLTLPADLHDRLVRLWIRFTPEAEEQQVLADLMDWLEQALRNYQPAVHPATPAAAPRDQNEQEEILLAAELTEVWNRALRESSTLTPCPFGGNDDQAWLAVARTVLKREHNQVFALKLEDIYETGNDRQSGVRMIAIERARQIEQEGHTEERDDQYDHQQLTNAAIAYARSNLAGQGIGQAHWPWQPSTFKPTTSIRNLVKAGALLAAEIDRLQRLAK